jgi:predicted unusual protein kinase regulating ubiquinone biosynthesis (AarF/ABC1/UbiB family)
MTHSAPNRVPFDLGRYLRVVRFFAGAFARVIWWEVILRRVLGRRLVSRSAPRRWGQIARRFRTLSIELGGVLIKLGQFLSVRVDVLPREFTSELADLQDTVPAEELADIQAVVAAEYGQPVDQVFAWFAPDPEAAASLAQVHRARLLNGDEVVVKIQRPRIETLVETDLRAVRTAMRWLKRFRVVHRRVNLDRLYEEFSRTTRCELDFVAEGENAERFAQDFADEPGVRVPKVYRQSSTRRVLIMENVANIKITDFEAIEAAGVSRAAVARRLFDTYLCQLFVHNFLHADPHPGNLFVRPLKGGQGGQGLFDAAVQRGAELVGESVQDAPGVPFELIFVDFGMVATVPERMRDHFRDYLVGFATRDAARMVHAYQGAGVLLPGADLKRLEEIEAELLDRYWGLTLGQAREVIANEWQSLAREYRDVLYEMPFQLPTDLLFVGRALSILFGMASALDPDFDPWAAIGPFAQQMASGEARRDPRALLAELERATRLILSLPGRTDRFLTQASQGELAVRTSWAPENERTAKRIESAVNRLTWTLLFASLLLAAVAVYVTRGGEVVSYVLFGLAAVVLVVALARR